MKFDAVIFDFDGVIADSERLSNSVLADALTAVGYPTTMGQAVDRYIGLHWADTTAAIETHIGGRLPPGFKESTSAVFQARVEEVAAVPGVAEFLERIASMPKAVASSSSTRWLRTSLERFGLAHHFGDRLFSAAEHVARGKPAPDIYLYAALQLGVQPNRALVIEDTAPGIAAARAAGMYVVGLSAGGHCTASYCERLAAAGADAVAPSFDQILELIE
jgi:HAD superfamily hydrolase (TIGR01509 family)